MKNFHSYFIDVSAAKNAVEITLPMIQAAMESRVAGEGSFLYIVIMKPGSSPTRFSFEEAILYEHAFGDRTKWDADYAKFARAKAKVSWKTGMDGHTVQELKPYLLEEGDTVLWGSVAFDDIVVGVSGADPWYDEVFAGTIAMCLRASAKKSRAAAVKQQPFLEAS